MNPVREGGGTYDNREEKLYQAICKEIGVDSLSDEEVDRLISRLKECLGELGNSEDLSLGQMLNVDAHVS